jgi:hypothetical protein
MLHIVALLSSLILFFTVRVCEPYLIFFRMGELLHGPRVMLVHHDLGFFRLPR